MYLMGDQTPAGRGTFEGACAGQLTYLPPANVPAQCTRRTNAFASAMGDRTAMRPLAKLLWTLVVDRRHICKPVYIAGVGSGTQYVSRQSRCLEAA